MVKLGELPDMPLNHLTQDINIFVPAVLGLGHSKLRNKLSALLHTLKLEVTSNPQLLKRYLDSVVGICTDQGVEAGIFCAPNVDLAHFLKQEASALDGTISLALQGDDKKMLHPLHVPPEIAKLDGKSQQDPSHAQQAQAASSLTGRLFGNALFIPGMKHCLDNVLSDIWSAMSGRDTFMRQLGSLEFLLRPAPYRDKLRSLFFNSDNAYDKTMSEQLRNWTAPSLKSLRWHVVIDFIKQLMKIKEPLCKRWNMGKFVSALPQERHEEIAEGRGTDPAVNYKRVDTAIASKFFWSYCQLVLDVSKASETLSHWCEGCWYHGDSCHEQQCPYKGARAPELASGAHKFLLEACQVSANTRINCVVASMSGHESSILLGDWHAAQARLQLEFQYRLHYWDLLPWKLCALACPSLEIARAMARECKLLWSNMSDSQKRVAHPMARRFLDPGWQGGAGLAGDMTLCP